MLFSGLFFFLVVCCGIFLKNTKALNLLLIITLYFLFAFEHSDQDYMQYVKSYASMGDGNFFASLGYEPAFILFCSLGNSYELSFDAARAIVCVFEVCALVSAVKIFSNKIAFVFALFLIFPATADAELFRWLMGMCVIIIALPYLIRGANKRDYIVYGLLITIASLCHTSCIFFFLFYLILIKNKEKMLTIVFVSSAVLIITAQSNLLYKIFPVFYVEESITDKFQETEHSNIFGLAMQTVREFFIIMIGYMVYHRRKTLIIEESLLNKNMNLSRTKYGQSVMGKLLCSKIWDLNIVSILLIALATYSPQVQRLFHVLLFYNIISITCVKDKSRKLVFMTLCCCLMTLVLHLNNGEQNMEIFLSHFNEGFLVNFLELIELS